MQRFELYMPRKSTVRDSEKNIRASRRTKTTRGNTMTKQKRGMFSRMVAAIAATMGAAPVTRHYDDPSLASPELIATERVFGKNRRKRSSGGGSRRWATERKRCISGHLPCRPGTGTYFDMLVRKFGRREADKYQRCLIAGQPDLLPTPELLAATPDWAWRNG